MRVFDTIDVKIVKIGDSVGVYLPLEYEAMEGFEAEFSAGVDGNTIVFSIKPHIQRAVEETVNELWRDLRILYSKIGDIGEKAPWGEMEIVWQTREAYENRVPISADEVITHRHSRAIYGKEEYVTGNREDMRRGIHDTITKLCELAALRLGFKSELFARAFGQAVGNNFAFTSCLIGTCEVLCEIFNEEFTKVDDDRLWGLTSKKAQEAVKVAYDRIKYLENHPIEFSKEDERIRKKWGFQIQPI